MHLGRSLRSDHILSDVSASVRTRLFFSFRLCFSVLNRRVVSGVRTRVFVHVSGCPCACGGGGGGQYGEVKGGGGCLCSCLRF